MSKLTKQEQMKVAIKKLVKNYIEVNAYLKASDVIILLEKLLLPMVEEKKQNN